MTELDEKLRPYLMPEGARVEPALGPRVDGSAILSDEEILARARSAKNGSAQHFSELYDAGDISAYASASEADAALCSTLMFWASNDRAAVDRLFRGSALHRRKWDDRDDYRERTLDLATHATGGYRPRTAPTTSRPTVVPSASTGIGSGIGVTWASDVTPKAVDWIWRGRIARGKVTAIGGDPGVGKGTLGVDLAARISTGRDFPDGVPAPLGRVLLLSGEDDEADTITPRLMAAGCDRARVGVIGQVQDEDGRRRRISLDSDAELLMQQCREREADVLIIDPLASYLGGGTNSWRDSDMRRILDPLAEAAGRHRIGVLTVVHLTKDGGKSRALYRFQGSIANIAAARFGFLVAEVKDTPGLLALACVKSNLARKPATLTFRITAAYLQEINDEVGRVEWAGATDRTADELLEDDGKSSGALERAIEFLENYQPGRHPSDDIKDAARAAGVGKNALWEAKRHLGIDAKKRGEKAWDWVIPEHQ